MEIPINLVGSPKEMAELIGMLQVRPSVDKMANEIAVNLQKAAVSYGRTL